MSKSKRSKFTVEGIKGNDKRDGKFYFYIKWKGYDESECTWEPESNLLPDCKALLRDYKARVMLSAAEITLESYELILYNIQVPDPSRKQFNQQFDSEQTSYSLAMTSGNIHYRRVYIDNFKKRAIFVKTFPEKKAASSCMRDDIGCFFVYKPTDQILPPAPVDRSLEKIIRETVMACTENLFIIPQTKLNEILQVGTKKTPSVVPMTAIDLGEVALNRIFAKQFKKLVHHMGVIVKSDDIALYSQFSKFGSSKTDLIAYKLFDGKIQAVISMNEHEEEMDQPAEKEALVAEAQTEIHNQDKTWQVLAGMIQAASEITVQELVQGNLVQTVTIYGLTPVYRDNTTGIHELHINFKVNKYHIYVGTESIALPDGFDRVLFKFNNYY